MPDVVRVYQQVDLQRAAEPDDVAVFAERRHERLDVVPLDVPDAAEDQVAPWPGWCERGAHQYVLLLGRYRRRQRVPTDPEWEQGAADTPRSDQCGPGLPEPPLVAGRVHRQIRAGVAAEAGQHPAGTDLDELIDPVGDQPVERLTPAHRTGKLATQRLDHRLRIVDVSGGDVRDQRQLWVVERDPGQLRGVLLLHVAHQRAVEWRPHLEDDHPFGALRLRGRRQPGHRAGRAGHHHLVGVVVVGHLDDLAGAVRLLRAQPLHPFAGQSEHGGHLPGRALVGDRHQLTAPAYQPQSAGPVEN